MCGRDPAQVRRAPAGTWVRAEGAHRGARRRSDRGPCRWRPDLREPAHRLGQPLPMGEPARGRPSRYLRADRDRHGRLAVTRGDVWALEAWMRQTITLDRAVRI